MSEVRHEEFVPGNLEDTEVFLWEDREAFPANLVGGGTYQRADSQHRPRVVAVYVPQLDRPSRVEAHGVPGRLEQTAPCLEEEPAFHPRPVECREPGVVAGELLLDQLLDAAGVG